MTVFFVLLSFFQTFMNVGIFTPEDENCSYWW